MQIAYPHQPVLRGKLIFWTLDKMLAMHSCLHFHRGAWKLTTSDLLAYPPGSLGRRIGSFLQSNHLEPIPKVERHDVFHVLTAYGTDTVDEVALQVFLLGNGKRSLFNLLAAGSCLLLPDYWSVFQVAFRRGRRARNISDYHFQSLLQENYADIMRYFITCDSVQPDLEQRIQAAYKH
ncbi:MAG: hypothetical protein SFW35_00180 [Chitinophagales bacterium]|nr:hypothetical protein [Chitinophagales bacterium]